MKDWYNNGNGFSRALRLRGTARLTYVTLLQVSKDEQILYRFVVRDEEAAMLVPLSEPDQNKTRKLLVEKDVRQIQNIIAFSFLSLPARSKNNGEVTKEVHNIIIGLANQSFLYRFNLLSKRQLKWSALE